MELTKEILLADIERARANIIFNQGIIEHSNAAIKYLEKKEPEAENKG